MRSITSLSIVKHLITFFRAGLLLSGILLATELRGAERQVLSGHVLNVTRNLHPFGPLPADTQVRLAIGLPLRNKEVLTNLLQQIYNPASPSYHHYLTSAEFAERFGPTERDYQSVIDFLTGQGFVVTDKHPNRVLVDVKGSAGTIEKAFHLNMKLYQHPTENRTFYAPDVEPSLDLTIPLLDIRGLNNFQRPHPKIRLMPKNSPGKSIPKAGSGPQGMYMGNDFRTAYVPGTPLTGAGQAVGLLQFDGFYPYDIAAYEAQAGLPSPTITTVLLDGYNGAPTFFGNDEVSLDIEMVVSMAPGISQIIVYEAGPFGEPNDILNRMANDNLARQIGCSWGWSGGPQSTTEQIFQQMAAQGQSFFNASGDDDAYPPGTVDDPDVPGSPSSSPNVTQVGGTILATSGPNGSWQSEVVWNRYDDTGSAGGFSSYYSMPTWQQGIDMTGAQGSPTMRNFPDVAMVAEDVFVRSGNGDSFAVGGTSCAAPLWAAFTALVNQQAAANSQAAVGFINPMIYSIGKGTNFTAAFHDITVGDNTSHNSVNEFYAVPGYDLCTGWGSPMGTNFINAMVQPPATNTPPTILGQPLSTSVPVGANPSFSVVVSSFTPVGYQWRRNGNNINGATTNSYALVNVATNDAGSFSVVVTNMFGSVTSSDAILSVFQGISYGEALDNNALVWSSSGDALWTNQPTVTHDGVDASQSGAIGNSQSSSVSATVTGPGTINFWWKVSSQNGYDYLAFLVNGTRLSFITGEINWQQVTMNLPAGTQVLTWRYVKDDFGIGGQDHGWLDQVAFTSTAAAVPLGDALDAPNLVWTVGGTSAWIGETNVTHDGVDCGQSGAIGNAESSWMQTTVTGPGNLTFWWKVSSEVNHDLLQFAINGTTQSGISGEQDWALQTFSIPAGSQTLTWTYSKDATLTSGLDKGWVDQVVYASAGSPMRLQAPVRLPGGNFRLIFGGSDGYPVDSSRLPNFDVYASSNLPHWFKLTNTLIATNGMVQMDEPPGTILPKNFYRVIERR